MFRNIFYILTLYTILSCIIIQGAAEKPPITVGKITYLPYYRTTYYVYKDGEATRAIDDLSEKRLDEKFHSADVTNGSFTRSILDFKPGATSEGIINKIKKRMLKKDPAYPESTLYKTVAANLPEFERRAAASKSEPEPDVLIEYTSIVSEEYYAQHSASGKQRTIINIDDLRPGEIIIGSSWKERKARIWVKKMDMD